VILDEGDSGDLTPAGYLAFFKELVIAVVDVERIKASHHTGQEDFSLLLPSVQTEKLLLPMRVASTQANFCSKVQSKDEGWYDDVVHGAALDMLILLSAVTVAGRCLDNHDSDLSTGA